MLLFELFPLFVAIVSALTAVALVMLNRQASRQNDLFVTAASSYLLFEDPWAMQAAMLGVLTNERDMRRTAIGALRSIARSPDPVMPSLLAADAGRTSPLQQRAPLEAAVLVGRRAAHLATLIERSDGNLHHLRGELVHQAPRYERVLRDGWQSEGSPFADLDPAAIRQLRHILTGPPSPPPVVAAL